MNISPKILSPGEKIHLSLETEKRAKTVLFRPVISTSSSKPVNAGPVKLIWETIPGENKYSVISCEDKMGGAGERYDFPGCSHVIRSSGYLLIRLAQNRYLLAVSLRCRFFLPEWGLNENKLSLTLYSDGKKLKSQEKYGDDCFMLTEGESVYQVMRRYGEMTAELHPRLPRLVPVVWRGFGMWWDYTAEQLLEAFRYCKKTYSVPLNIMQVDAGYCDWGDWTDVYHDVFPDGIADFVQKIRRENAHTGLWAAPCLAEKNSKIFREHPEYLLKRSDGKPYLFSTTGKIVGILDYSQDEVCERWRKQLTMMRREWGVTYFKFDFIDQELIPLTGKNPITPNERYQRFLSITNDVCGQDTYILGCNAHFSATFGQCDAFRLGADITPTYPRETASVRTSAAHAMLHNCAVSGDADYLELRGPETPLPVLGHKHGTLSLDEAKMWAQYETLFNHILLPADDPRVLEEERLELVRQVLKSELCDEVCNLAPFAGDADLPPSLMLARRGQKIELHLFNWSEQTQKYRVFEPNGPLSIQRVLTPHTSEVVPIRDPRSFSEIASLLQTDLPEKPRSLVQAEMGTFSPGGKLRPLDLGSDAAFSLTCDREGGMMLHDGTYAELTGLQTFCGISFDLSGNRGIQISFGESGSRSVPIRAKATRLYFLHSAMFPVQGKLLDFLFHYGNGHQACEEIIVGDHVGNTDYHYSAPWQGNHGKIGWCDPYTGQALYVSCWENPFPEQIIEQIEFTPLCQHGIWNLLGITAEQ